MTHLPYKDSSARALRLRLYEGPVGSHGPQVLASGTANRDDIRIHASVIGSSHVMEVRGRDVTLTELLACEPLATGSPVALWEPGGPVIEYVGREGVRYSFEARTMDWDRAVPEFDLTRSLILSAEDSSSELGLAFRFPDGRSSHRAAETLVWAAACDGGVRARTVHSYPTEGLVVVSETTIEMARTEAVGPQAEIGAAA